MIGYNQHNSGYNKLFTQVPRIRDTKRFIGSLYFSGIRGYRIVSVGQVVKLCDRSVILFESTVRVTRSAMRFYAFMEWLLEILIKGHQKLDVY